MINSLSLAIEEWFGIKADPLDIKKLQDYLWKTYGGENSQILKQVFLSGEAADFLTVNETYFFREPAHFSLLWDFLSSFKKSKILVCSAAVAAGCEAYSIAMLIEAYNKTLETPFLYHIDAFDINPKVIETALQGKYNARALREDGKCFHYLANSYLAKLESGYQIAVSLKENISFFVHNLMNPLYPKTYDIIFFRNAFIYFLPKYRERILSNLSAVLNDDGILIVGVSETAGAQHPGLKSINRNDVFYFQKNAEGRIQKNLDLQKPNYAL